MTYLDCWISTATTLFSQALAGEPQLVDDLPRPVDASLAYAAEISGERQGRFSVVLDRRILDAPLLGEGMDQQAGWNELLREVADAAAGELLARTGMKCHVDSFSETDAEGAVTQAFQLKAGERGWTILVRDQLAKALEKTQPATPPGPVASTHDGKSVQDTAATLSPGLELLLDVELEATLRFGCRELPLGEILELGSGDVVQLDRHISDPADLIVGDKIVARGEVVLVNGNFGLRVTEIAEPRKRLESIRCLF
ncbi:MAG TPA: FliM/FliN family flagellar motor switch protein [Terracidiphilus sp.]|jgi:flagellar motor switch protein FliN